MSDTNCPYCGADVEIDHDGGYGCNEGETHQQECPKCDKTFIYQTMISFDYDVAKADCLNGAEHQFERTQTYPPEFAKLRCKVCGETAEIKPTP
jgi:hypothetical protein